MSDSNLNSIRAAYRQFATLYFSIPSLPLPLTALRLPLAQACPGVSCGLKTGTAQPAAPQALLLSTSQDSCQEASEHPRKTPHCGLQLRPSSPFPHIQLRNHISPARNRILPFPRTHSVFPLRFARPISISCPAQAYNLQPHSICCNCCLFFPSVRGHRHTMRPLHLPSVCAFSDCQQALPLCSPR